MLVAQFVDHPIELAQHVKTSVSLEHSAGTYKIPEMLAGLFSSFGYPELRHVEQARGKAYKCGCSVKCIRLTIMIRKNRSLGHSKRSTYYSIAQNDNLLSQSEL